MPDGPPALNPPRSPLRRVCEMTEDQPRRRAFTTDLGVQILEALGVDSSNVVELTLQFEPGSFVIATVKSVVMTDADILPLLKEYELVERVMLSPVEAPPASTVDQSALPADGGRPAC